MGFVLKSIILRPSFCLEQVQAFSLRGILKLSWRLYQFDKSKGVSGLRDFMKRC